MILLFLIENINGYHYGRLDTLGQMAKELGHRLVITEIFQKSNLYSHEDSLREGEDAATKHAIRLNLDRNSAKLTAISSKIHAIIREEKPDVVVSLGFHQRYNFLLRLHCLISGIHPKWIFCSDSKADDGPRHFPKEIIKRLMAKCYDGAFVAGAKHQKYWTSMGFPSDRIAIGYDVVDNLQYHPVTNHEKDSKKQILCVARLVERKAVDLLLQAFSIASPGKDWELVIAGDGPLKSALTELAEKLDIAEKVRFLGSVKSGDMKDLYHESKFLILPSLWDQWGLSVNEAFASGIPAIVSDACGCAHEIVIPGVTGLVFPAGSPQNLAGLIAVLCSNESLISAMGSQARALIRAWSPDSFSKQLLELADSVCCKSSLTHS